LRSLEDEAFLRSTSWAWATASLRMISDYFVS
jgi:hypothetical protein